MPLRILVVDDSPLARKRLIKALPAHWDVEIAEADGGLAALQAYQAGGVDLMFLDLTMPDLNGYQVLETVRRNDLNCLVIVVSADVQPGAQERVKNLGAAAFVRKPIDPQQIQAVLKEYGILA
jgi:CheY-like chemotaxis protein